MGLARDIAAPYVKHDQYCADLPKQRYTVRSIYFDSEDMDFYFEKLDSVRVRKKLRVRTYNLAEDRAPAFLEIKRKIGRRGLKERVMMDLALVGPLLDGGELSELLPDLPFLDRKVVDKFRFNMKMKRLRPVVLVVYEREAFVGIDNERWRMTLDHNLRSLINPVLGDMFVEQDLQQFEDRNFVLELKFDDRMPRWMTSLVRQLNLRAQSYSKYVHGIDTWTHQPH